jgi:hypothetical protein
MLLIKNKMVESGGRGHYTLTFHLDSGETLIAKIEIDQSAEIADRNVEAWIDEFRKGTKQADGSYTGWYKKKTAAMGNRQWCIDKMKLFFERHPEYTKEDVFNARDLYFRTLKTSYGDYQFLQQADYFISKEVNQDGKRVVREELLKYCEELEDGADAGTGAQETRITRRL